MTEGLSLPLPTSDNPELNYTVPLNGVKYRFLFSYSTRSPVSWYLTVSTLSEELLISKVRLVPYMSLFEQHTRTDLPKGTLAIYHASEDYQNTPTITLENLSKEFTLLYLPVS